MAKGAVIQGYWWWVPWYGRGSTHMAALSAAAVAAASALRSCGQAPRVGAQTAGGKKPEQRVCWPVAPGREVGWDVHEGCVPG